MEIDFSRSALLIVDVQHDFCEGGALAVPEGSAVIEPLNRAARLFARHGSPVAATQDWHPAGHCSFAVSGGIWPEHCVQGSHGAALHDALDLQPVTLILRKGFRPGLDSYSAFFENDKITPTGLDGFLKTLRRDTLYLGGLAADYCVLYSALDAKALGYHVIVALDAVRAVNQPEKSGEKAFITMKDRKIKLIDSIV